MTFQQIQRLFDWLPEEERPQRNSSHSVLFMIDSQVRLAEVCLTLSDEDVKYDCSDSNIIKAQVED